MIDYLAERMRRRLMVAAGLVVAAYALQWSGTLHVASKALDAGGRITLQAYDLTAQEAAAINIANGSSIRLLNIMGQSAALYAVLFAAGLALCWRFLPRRAASAAAALGMLATFALPLPFAPADAFVRSVTGESLWSYGLFDREDVAAGGVATTANWNPWPVTVALAGDGTGIDAEREAKVALLAEVVSEMAFGIPEAVAAFAALIQPVIVVGFWSTLLGLVAVSLRRRRREA